MLLQSSPQPIRLNNKDEKDTNHIRFIMFHIKNCKQQQSENENSAGNSKALNGMRFCQCHRGRLTFHCKTVILAFHSSMTQRLLTFIFRIFDQRGTHTSFHFYLNKSVILESNQFTSEAIFPLFLKKITLQNLLVRTVKISYIEYLCLKAKPITLTFPSLPNTHSLYVKI